MQWIKERILEAEWEEPSHPETVHRVHFRLRSDGSMWYQVLCQRHGVFDFQRSRLESRFDDFLKKDPAQYGAHTGWTEQDFDQEFGLRLKRMNGKEIFPTIQ